MIIKALNMYGRVPETWELLEEIERLNNIINELSKENQELKEKTKLFHKNRVFSLEYDKETLRDMVLEYQEKIDKAIEYIEDNSDDMHTYISQVLTDILKGSDSNVKD